MATSSARGSSSAPRNLLGRAVRRAERRLHGWQTNLLGIDVPAPAGSSSKARSDRSGRPAKKGSPDAVVKTVKKLTGAQTPEQVRRTVETWGAQDLFFSALVRDEPLDTALVGAARRLLRLGSVDRVRSLANALRSTPEHASLADVLGGLVAMESQLPAMAWEQLTAADRDQVLRLAPSELFRSGFLTDPAAAGDALASALRDDAIDASAAQWWDIACTSFAAKRETESREALTRAKTLALADGDERLVTRIEWLEDWYGTAETATQKVTAPAGTVPFAVLDYKQPDEAFASKNLGDHVQTIASMGHLVRRSGFRFSGEDDAVRVARMLQERVKPERVVDGDDADITLYRVQRDASSHDLVPDGTWVLAFGWYMHRQFGVAFDMPMNPRLRPIFVSFHVNAPAFLTDDVLAYLRRYAPVGCRDWNTVHLLQAAGVPAFFSGCLTTTVDTVFPAAPDAEPSGTLYVDTPPTGAGVFWQQTAPSVRRRGFADNVDDAIEVLTSYQQQYANVVTSRLHCCLPARSLGANVEFRAKNPADVRFDGLIGISDAAFEDIRRSMLALLEPVVGAIGAGRPEDEVYALWRELTAPAVAAAEALRRDVPDLPDVSFDVAAVCRAAQERAVTFERTAEVPAGEPVAVELTLDADDVARLDVVLESLVDAATRPVDVHLLTRGVREADVARVARLFPSLTVTWWPLDDLDHGASSGDPRSVATIDRLLLPELLRDVPRVVHLDVDAVCVGDVAELSDTDLAGTPLAARTSPDPATASGFLNAINASKRTKDDPLAREIILRTHTRHAFDYPAFHAGVMVLDLQRMRDDAFAQTFLPWVERYGLGAQDVLNTYVGPDRAHLEPRWNRLPHVEVVPDGAAAVCWTGPQKPWGPESVAGQEIWDDLAAKAALRAAAVEDASVVS